MFIIYDFIFLLFSLFYLPVYLFKNKFHPGFSSRLGVLPRGFKLDKPIWIHAVSVGEAMAVKKLVEQLRKAYPNKQFVISTVTPTGNKIAKGMAGENDFVTFLPLDFGFIVKKAIDSLNPSLFVIAETEIWPNLITYLNKRKIPVIIVNGRISDSSFRGYLKIRFLIKSIFRKVTLFCVQTERDANRFSSLGVDRKKIKVTGNMKFDATPSHNEMHISSDLKSKLGLQRDAKIFVAASTHPREEQIILSVYARLLETFPELSLIIAPRHPQRFKEVSKIISGFQFCSRPFSRVSEPFTCATKTVFVVDTIGELNNFYNIADIVFVGGSLIKKGGHNILEPAVFSKPILFGPHMFNFKDIAELFLSNEAAVLVNNASDMQEGILNFLNHPSIGLEFGKRAQQLIEKNKGAVNSNLEVIRNFVV